MPTIPRRSADGHDERRIAELIEANDLVVAVCPTCHGRGIARLANANAPTGFDTHNPCPNCEGDRSYYVRRGTRTPGWRRQELLASLDSQAT